MTVSSDSLPETDLTQYDGIVEWKVVEILHEVGDGPEWVHWRTTPNYTCMQSADGTWLVQVGRNDPIVSVMHLGKGIDGMVILQSPEDAIMLMMQAAQDPKDALVEIVERSDEHGVFVQRYEGEPSVEQLQAARQRQEAWGDRATETPTRSNEGDA